MEGIESLRGSCFTTNGPGPTRWELCPFGSATARRGAQVTTTLNWAGVVEDNFEGMRLTWNGSPGCDLSVAFVCAGEDELIVTDSTDGFEFIGPQCGQQLGWLYHPLSCRIDPGKLMHSEITCT